MINNSFSTDIVYYTDLTKSFSSKFFEIYNAKDYKSCFDLVLNHPKGIVESQTGAIYLFKNMANDYEDLASILMELMKFLVHQNSSDHEMFQIFQALQRCPDARKELLEKDPKFKHELEMTIFTLLINNPQQTQFLDYSFDCLKWLFEQIVTRKFQGVYDIQIINELALGRYVDLLHLFICRREVSFLSFLRENNFISEELEEKHFKYITADVLKSYRTLCSIWHEFTSLNFFEQLTFISQFEFHIKKLKDINFPELDKLIERIKYTIEPISNLLVGYESVYEEWKKKRTFSKSDVFIISDDLLSFAVFKKDIAFFDACILFQSHYCPPSRRSQMTYHLMMDNMGLPDFEKYEGANSDIAAATLIYSLTKLQRENPLSNKNVTLLIQKVNAFFIPLLKSYMLCRIFPGPAVSQIIVKRLKNLQVDQSALLPSGTKHHAICLLVTKTLNDCFNLTIFNTGDGLTKWHFCYENSNHFQTSLKFYQIPSSSIISQEFWGHLYNEQPQTIDFIYQHIHDSFTFISKLPPPLRKEYYERAQVTGTCAMACLMSCINSYVRDVAEGTVLEKKTTASLFKTLYSHAYVKESYSVVDENIQKQLSTIVLKFEAEVKMLEIADDDLKFQNAIKQLGLLFNSGIPFPREHTTSNMGRFAILRNASKILSTLWIYNSEIGMSENEPEADAFALAFANLKHKRAKLQNFKVTLDKIEKRGVKVELTHMLYHIMVKYKYPDFVISETVNYINKGILNFSQIKLLLKNLNKHKNYSDTVEKLIVAVEKSEKPHFAPHLQVYWQTVNSTAL
jgi:hypothetical protein